MKKILFLLCTLIIQQTVFAQSEDAENCKDHPMFNRMSNFRIYECSENFAALQIQTGNETTEEHEGTRTHLKYLIYNPENTVKIPS